VNWSWSADTVAGGTGTTFAPTFFIPGNYNITLTVTTEEGCTDTYTYTQVVIPAEIVVPNVFSPNSDGANDALVFEGAQYYPNTSLSVFNRWGQEVFSSTNYKNTWRGTDMPTGTYFYVLKLVTGKEYSGNVTLLR
jgi:gliding motility-associated-like protein